MPIFTVILTTFILGERYSRRVSDVEVVQSTRLLSDMMVGDAVNLG